MIAYFEQNGQTKIVDVVEYYDEPNNRGAVTHRSEGEAKMMVYDFAHGEAFVIKRM